MTSLINFLQSIVPISTEDCNVALQYFKNIKLQKGDFFLQHNKVCHEVAFITKGTLRVFYHNKEGEEVTSCFCSSLCFSTSYKSFISQQPSLLAIEALDDVELLVINREHLYMLYESYPIWQKIGRILAENEYLNMEKYASILNTESAKEKYLRLINEQPGVLQLASLEDIASYLGVTRRTLSRIRNELAISK